MALKLENLVSMKITKWFPFGSLKYSHLECSSKSFPTASFMLEIVCEDDKYFFFGGLQASRLFARPQISGSVETNDGRSEA